MTSVTPASAREAFGYGRHRGMKTAIVITNFNYGGFITQAIHSSLHQTATNIVVVVVDDGSTDDSADMIKLAVKDDLRCSVILKQNGGQLSAFNAAVAALPNDVSVVVFLDADDVLEPHCVATLAQVYEDRPDIDCVFSTPRPFSEPEPPPIEASANRATDIGFTTAAAWFCQEWIGVPTSGLSMRASLVRKLLPLPLESDWRIRADDCLVWGSSLAGARKLHLGGTLAHYRLHGNNSFHGRSCSDADNRYRRALAVHRLWQHFDSRFALSRLDGNDLYLEFRTKPDRGAQQAIHYTRIVWAARLGIAQSIRIIAKIWARWAYDLVIPSVRDNS